MLAAIIIMDSLDAETSNVQNKNHIKFFYTSQFIH